jgi:rRNA-processing protein FCF1
MRIVIFDSNFLLLPAQIKLDIYKELPLLFEDTIQIYIYACLFAELEKKICTLPQEAKLRREYRFSRELLNLQKYELIDQHPQIGQTVDDFLVGVATQLLKQTKLIYIATNDQELRKKCEKKKIGTIFLRNGNRLEKR